MEQMDVERPRRTSPARGVALIATAVIIGLFVLRNGFDTSSGGPSIKVADESSDTTAATTPGSSGDTSDTTAAPTARAPGEVTVMVANTTSVSGAAGGLTQNLVGKGYKSAPATDADPALEQTQVLFVEGYQLEAQAVAAAIQAPAESVQAMPNPPPIPDLAGAQVVVMLGADLAAG